jgi:polar amino acid transport system permease protein
MFRFDPERGGWTPSILVEGLFTTVRLSIWAGLLATVTGTSAGLCRVSGKRFRRLLGSCYVELIRNLPALVLVFIFYYFVSDRIMPVLGLEELAASAPQSVQGLISLFVAQPARLSAFVSAVITLGLYEGAYIAEIVRAGVSSIEKGQWDAAHALGLSRLQQLRHVILPQALQRILPPLAGQFISTIKDSAIVSVISIQDLTFQGMELMASTYLTFEIWITVALMYFVLTFACSLAVNRLESHMQKSDR